MDLAELSVCRGCYCLAARRAARAITRMYEEKLRPVGLRGTQFTILAALALAGPRRVGELATLLDLERTTVTRSAAIMQRNGWVSSGSTNDAREHLLSLTDEGRAKLEQAFPAWQEAHELVGQKIANEDGLRFIQVIQ